MDTAWPALWTQPPEEPRDKFSASPDPCLAAHSPPQLLSYKTTYGGGEEATGSAEREVLGTEIVLPAQQTLGRDELQWH